MEKKDFNFGLAGTIKPKADQNLWILINEKKRKSDKPPTREKNFY
jgi:hypothetical protein